MATTLIEQNNTIEYFKNLVENAIENQKLNINEMEEFYIVNLLKENVCSNNLYLSSKDGVDDEPLAIILHKAVKASDYSERVKRFKKLGDFTLFISGFFSDSLNRKLIDVDYYKAIGESAYANMSNLMKKNYHGDSYARLFRNLAKRFQELVDILSEVSDKSFVNSDTGVLRIYERWVKTGSKRDAELLKEKGIIPILQENCYLQ